jgi:hypothetical protein
MSRGPCRGGTGKNDNYTFFSPFVDKKNRVCIIWRKLGGIIANGGTGLTGMGLERGASPLPQSSSLPLEPLRCETKRILSVGESRCGAQER